MLSWIAANTGTIIVLFVLIAVVTGIISVMIKDKKQGRHTCGGNCAHCKMCTGCRETTGPGMSQAGKTSK